MNKLEITVLEKNSCIACTRVKKKFDSKQVTYNVLNIETDPTAENLIAEYQIKSAPGIVVKDSEGNIVKVWGGYNVDNMEELFEKLNAA